MSDNQVRAVLQVVLLRDGGLVGTEVFPPGQYVIGSNPDSDLVLAAPGVAPLHALLAFKDNRVFLQDQRSPSGVVVNGQRLTAAAEVRGLDDVGIGPFTLKFRVTGKRPQLAVAQPADVEKTDPGTATTAPELPRVVAEPPRPPPPAPRPVAPPPAVRAAPNPAPAAMPVAAPVAPRVAVAVARTEPTVPAVEAAPVVEAVRTDPLGVAPPEEAEPPTSGLSDPFLRVRVFWRGVNVGVHAFPYGRAVHAGAREREDVPLYGFQLPEQRFVIARTEASGWVARVPAGATAFSPRDGRWQEVQGLPDPHGKGEATLVPLELGRPLRVVQGPFALELVPAASVDLPRESFAFEKTVLIPFAVASVVALAVAIAASRYVPPPPSDFTPKQLAAARAILIPPEKKPPPKKPEPVVKRPPKPVEKAPELPPEQKQAVAAAPKEVKEAIKAVQKITAAPAVAQILAATQKLTGPRGYGDKGSGYKVSPLIGKPPITMAGLTQGQGLGGFGAQTKGFGAIRGSGGQGPGAFAVGGMGKGKVGGTVVSAPSRGAQVKGSLDREQVAKVINDHLAEVRGCYERALLKEPGLGGKLVLEWTIDPSGSVSEVKSKSSTLKGAEVPGCIISSLKGWRFPRPRGGPVIVSFPFLFNSSGF